VIDHLKPVVVGPDELGAALAAQSVEEVTVDWRPPGAPGALKRLYEDADRYEAVQQANEDVMRRIVSARARWTAVRAAQTEIPGLERGVLLHAGPPLDWASASGPMRGALIGALLYEEWAETAEQAEHLLASGQIELHPCHEHGAVGPMAGVVSPSMPVVVVENERYGNRAFSTLNEGLGKVLRYGANDPEVLGRLRWLQDVAGPALGQAVERGEGIDLTGIIAQALQMGDELHNRNKAATALLTRQMAGALSLVCDDSRDERSKIFHYLAETDVFFLNLAMAACKAALDPAAGFTGSTVVTAMARNGTEFGIRTAGTGDRWFTAAAPGVEGLYFPGFGPHDANPDLGDSAITETAGLGGFALAAAPAIVQFVGGSVSRGREITEEMYQITLAEHPVFQLPALDFRGSPVGIDCIAVARTGIAPVLDTGIAHKRAGIGQIGAGIVRVPIEPFVDALESLVV